MSTDTYTLDVDADEAALVMEYRARKNAPPQAAPKPKPKAEPKHRLDRVALLASLALVCVMLVLAGFKVAEYVAAYAAAFAGVQPTAEPLPTARVVIPAAPVSAPQPRSAPVAVNPVSVYPDTVAAYQAGAWTPGGPFTLDVAGRHYRALGMQGGATFAELDDGTRVWLGTPGESAPVIEAAPAAQPTAPPIGPVETWGEGGTTGGSTWGEPTALPLQNAIIPAMPQLDAPTPTWGEGGSTGGATW